MFKSHFYVVEITPGKWSWKEEIDREFVDAVFGRSNGTEKLKDTFMLYNASY